MLPRTMHNRPMVVYERIEIETEAILQNLTDVAAGPASVSAATLIELQKRLVRFRNYLQSTIGLAGLQAFMRSSSGLNNASYDWSAAVSAIQSPGQAVVDWIKTNVGTSTTTAVGDDTQARVVDATALAPLINTLISAITT